MKKECKCGETENMCWEVKEDYTIEYGMWVFFCKCSIDKYYLLENLLQKHEPYIEWIDIHKDDCECKAIGKSKCFNLSKSITIINALLEILNKGEMYSDKKFKKNHKYFEAQDTNYNKWALGEAIKKYKESIKMEFQSDEHEQE